MSARFGRSKSGPRIAAFATALIALVVFSLAGVSPTGSPTAALATPAHAVLQEEVDLNNFVIDSFSGEYRLSTDEEG